MNGQILCASCGKDLGFLSFKTFAQTYKGINEKGNRKLFCDENCYNKYWKQFIVENYKGTNIFKIIIKGKDLYLPYAGCQYAFKNIEDCKKRIDNTHISVIRSDLLISAIKGFIQ